MAKSSQQDAVRLKAQQLRQEQARKDRTATIIVISVVSVLVLAIVAAVGVVVARQIAADRAARNVDPTTVFGQYADAQPITYSHLGVGKVDPALPTLVEYFDYSCYGCVNLDSAIGTALSDGAKAGEYNIEFRSVRTHNAAYQEAATAASLTVANAAPDQWVAFHHALMSYYLTQQQAGNGTIVNDASKSAAQVKVIAAEVGVPQEVIDTFPVGAVAATYLDKASAAWTALEVEGREQTATPEFVHDGKVIAYSGTTGVEVVNSIRSAMGLDPLS
ncbi:DsbA family protein [Schaalia suimastitidis]|uniref:DsbA family protein n=1 Tax=Schaalia suimastitidis TaxID=121163 RepID=UPI000421262A|nr:DsbA family protein [Schaalia suimastitidis]